MVQVVRIICEDHDRAKVINEGLLEFVGLVKGCTLIYSGPARFELQCDDAKDALEWLIAGEVVDPTREDFEVELGHG